jgi:hypothetical protein
MPVVRRSAAVALSLLFLISPGTPVVERSVAGAAGAVPVDGGWPRTYTTASGARFVLYEPQVAGWAEQKRIVMYAAVSYAGRGEQTPALGTLRIESDTRLSPEDRLVDFSRFTITSATFPTLSRDQLDAAVKEIDASVPRDERVIGLDRVLASIDMSQVTPRNVDGVRADPPSVFYSTTPAVLVNLDGDPVWSPTRDRDLRFAVNTSSDLVEHLPSGSYYLRVGTTWMKATDIDGPWTLAGRPPDGLLKLADDDRWKNARAASTQPAAGRPSAVFVGRKPAELILLRGTPNYVAVAGTGLMWVSNTDSDVFRVGKTGPVYYLVSGRWFRAPDFKGPWTFATTALPDDFRKVPLDHPRARVLTSVPGTPRALEAVLLAQVPQTARVKRTEIVAPDVVYQGEPQFQPIEQATVARAVNTDKEIVKVDSAIRGGLDHYYLCYDGVWFVSTSATGPWTLAESVPNVVYSIPISSPAYRVTHVRVESADEESVVYAADAGYTGIVVAWGCAVWGTGWRYTPYVGWSSAGPVYYPRDASYAAGAVYQGSGRVFVRTATRAQGGLLWGPGSRVYGHWGPPAVERGEQWAKALRFPNWATGATPATQGRGGGGAISRRGPEAGDLFAGHDGNVYRYQSGIWQKYEHSGWSVVGGTGRRGAGTQQELAGDGLSAAVRDQLNHDLAARHEGNRRMSAAKHTDSVSLLPPDPHQIGSLYEGIVQDT